jgi:hypothetical protein
MFCSPRGSSRDLEPAGDGRQRVPLAGSWVSGSDRASLSARGRPEPACRHGAGRCRLCDAPAASAWRNGSSGTKNRISAAEHATRQDHARRNTGGPRGSSASLMAAGPFPGSSIGARRAAPAAPARTPVPPGQPAGPSISAAPRQPTRGWGGAVVDVQCGRCRLESQSFAERRSLLKATPAQRRPPRASRGGHGTFGAGVAVRARPSRRGTAAATDPAAGGNAGVFVFAESGVAGPSSGAGRVDRSAAPLRRRTQGSGAAHVPCTGLRLQVPGQWRRGLTRDPAGVGRCRRDRHQRRLHSRWPPPRRSCPPRRPRPRLRGSRWPGPRDPLPGVRGGSAGLRRPQAAHALRRAQSWKIGQTGKLAEAGGPPGARAPASAESRLIAMARIGQSNDHPRVVERHEGAAVAVSAIGRPACHRPDDTRRSRRSA